MRTKRRGIGNVIAAAVMVFLVVFTISQLYVYNLDKLDDYNRVAANVFNNLSQKQNERISISNVQLDVTTGPNIKVTLSVSNTGGLTSHIVAIWFDNADVSLNQHVRCVKGSCGWSSGTDLFVGQGLTLTTPTFDTGIPIIPTPNPKIVVKVITDLGNSVSVTLLPPSQSGTSSQTLATTSLTLVPPNPITSNNIVAILTVTNTNALGVAFTSITPDLCIAQGVTPPSGSAVTSGTATSATGTTLSDTGASWTANQWTSYIVKITSGTGVGQSRTINSNTGNQLTINSPWTTNPIAGSLYSIYTINVSCHSNTQVTGTAVLPFTPTTLHDSGKSWGVNQWSGNLLVITAGTGNGQSRQIASNTADMLTVNTAWTTTPDATSQYAVRTNFCNANSGTTSDSPVSCSKVQGPIPAGLTFLPAGGSIIFQWTYLVQSTSPDAPITFTGSYVNITTTTGLLISQIPSQTATIRQVGGTSSQGGQGIANFLGFLTIDITSFQYAKVSSGLVCWKTGFQPKGGENTVFRVHMTNIGSATITLNQDSEFVNLKASTGGGGQLQPQEYFIALGAQVSGGVIQPVALLGGGGVTITPGQTVAVYFGSSTQNGASAPSLPASGNRLFTFFVLLGTVTSFGESIPFVGLSTASSDPAGCFGTPTNPSSGPY